MKTTVLNSNHKRRGARMVEFGGWEMPVQYEGILAEHEYTRKIASLFDICHMGEFEVSGESARRDIEHLLTQNVRSLEIGLSLFGHDLSEARTPIAATRGKFIDMNKDFIGRAAVERDLRDGCRQYLTALRLAGRRAARQHDKVVCAGEIVGEVTSGSLSPSLGVAIALAYVNAEVLKRGDELEIDTRRGTLNAEIVDLPFYKKGTARKAFTY